MYSFISEEIINPWSWFHRGKRSMKCCQCSTWMNHKYVIHRTKNRGYICMYECWRLANLAYDNLNGILASKYRFYCFVSQLFW